MDATFTPEETKLIWEAVKYGEYAGTPEARARKAEAMRLLSAELRRVGVFPPLPPHPSDPYGGG